MQVKPKITQPSPVANIRQPADWKGYYEYGWYWMMEISYRDMRTELTKRRTNDSCSLVKSSEGGGESDLRKISIVFAPGSLGQPLCLHYPNTLCTECPTFPPWLLVTIGTRQQSIHDNDITETTDILILKR